MSAYRKLPHIACYDIADPKRLAKVHRYLKRVGIPLQYSVFLLQLNARERERVVQRLERLIDAREDDVRLYPLPCSPEWQWWGRPPFSDGVYLTDVGLPATLVQAPGGRRPEARRWAQRVVSGNL